jgi:hypothetical protein
MSLILNGTPYPMRRRVFGPDNGVLPPAQRNPRRQAIRAIVVHTTRGEARFVRPGAGPGGAAGRFASYEASTEEHRSWDFTIDRDGAIWQHNDPCRFVTWQASVTAVNEVSLGIELVQDADGGIYQAQLDALVDLLDALTRALGVQRQYPVTAVGDPDDDMIPRFATGQVAGILGHRNVTTNRGPGDPGDDVFRTLGKAGYEGFDARHDADLYEWTGRQRWAGARILDGLPGADTADALQRCGVPTGVWVQRPGDPPATWKPTAWELLAAVPGGLLVLAGEFLL